MGLSYHSYLYYHYYFCNDHHHIMLSSLSYAFFNCKCSTTTSTDLKQQQQTKQNFKALWLFFSPQAGLPPPLQTSHDVSLSSPDCKFTNVDNYSYKIL